VSVERTAVHCNVHIKPPGNRALEQSVTTTGQIEHRRDGSVSCFSFLTLAVQAQVGLDQRTRQLPGRFHTEQPKKHSIMGGDRVILERGPGKKKGELTPSTLSTTLGESSWKNDRIRTRRKEKTASSYTRKTGGHPREPTKEKDIGLDQLGFSPE